jgi:hypothetical protein
VPHGHDLVGVRRLLPVGDRSRAVRERQRDRPPERARGAVERHRRHRAASVVRDEQQAGCRVDRHVARLGLAVLDRVDPLERVADEAETHDRPRRVFADREQQVVDARDERRVRGDGRRDDPPVARLRALREVQAAARAVGRVRPEGEASWRVGSAA